MPLDKNETVLAQFLRLRAELQQAASAGVSSAGAAESEKQPISDEALATLVAADQSVAAINQFNVSRWLPWRKTQPSQTRVKD